MSPNPTAKTALPVASRASTVALALTAAGFVVTAVSMICLELRRETAGLGREGLAGGAGPPRKTLASPAACRSLCETIRGANRVKVKRTLGPPPATIGRGDSKHDDTWYYPLDDRRRLILVVEFAKGRAREVSVVEMSSLVAVD